MFYNSEIIATAEISGGKNLITAGKKIDDRGSARRSCDPPP